jgi:hypothetical protein
MKTDNTSDLLEIRNIFQMHYGTLNRHTARKYTFRTRGTAHFLHAVQQWGHKITDREHEVIFVFNMLHFTIKIQLKQKRHFPIFDLKEKHRIGLCNFKINFFFTFNTDYEDRGN